MKVLMFGWEFPPYSSGGLGTACYGLTKGLAKKGAEVTFVMPTGSESEFSSHINLIVADKSLDKVRFMAIDSLLKPYLTSSKYDRLSFSGKKSPLYGKDLFAEVIRFTEEIKSIVNDDFDVIHAHDWMTFKAGAAVKEKTKKPLIVHVHATEFDRTGDNPNQYVYNIEREGMHKADKIISVSNFTKNKIVEHYGINADKVEVVHNAIDAHDNRLNMPFRVRKMDKVVLFLGRITLQKGPDYFLYAAKKVLEKEPHVKFIIVGSGDMEPFIIEKAAELGIAHKVLFTGFLSGKDVERAYQLADLYVMPSVSEPFGLTPLEAIKNDVPVIISKQSGVSEVLQNCLKVDFWDINEMASKILAVLKYRPLQQSLRENAFFELQKFSWEIPAEKCIAVYNNVIGGVNG